MSKAGGAKPAPALRLCESGEARQGQAVNCFLEIRRATFSLLVAVAVAVSSSLKAGGLQAGRLSESGDIEQGPARLVLVVVDILSFCLLSMA